MPDQFPGALVSLGRSLRLGFRAEPRLLIVGFVTTVVAAAPDALFAVALSALVGAVVRNDGRAVLAASLSLSVLVTAGWLLTVASDRINLRLTDRAAVFIESHMARLYIEVPTIEHHERLDYVDRLTLLRDQAATLSELYQMLFSEIGAVLRLVITVAILISVRPVLGLLGLFAIPPVLLSHWRAGAERRTEESVAVHERLARSLFLLGTTADAAKEARTGQVQPMLVRKSDAARLTRYHAMARARTTTAVWVSLGYLLFGAALVTGVGLSANGKDAAAKVMLLLAAGSRLSQYVSQTVRETHLFRSIWLDGSRRLAWLEDYGKAQALPADAAVPVVLRDGIALDNVSFTYPGTDREVLKDISLKIPAGSVVAVVGENGAGKSTLIKLLCGFYQPTSGRITVDGTDLADVDVRAWRMTLSGAFQDFVKFEYPLSESVGIGDLSRVTDKTAVTAALRKAGAESLIASLGKGLDTQLGASWQDGVELSHGQWQKIALARGFMIDQPLMIVLDEPTSAFDVETEQEMFDKYATAAADSARTGQVTVLVSHRFSTVRMADLIVVLEGAHVIEAGSHADLMARGGTYAELFAIQAAAYAHTAASEEGPSGG